MLSHYLWICHCFLLISLSFQATLLRATNSSSPNPNDDSWVYYSYQRFNNNETNNQKLTQQLRNPTPSETLLFHGYVPAVNHLEDYRYGEKEVKSSSVKPTNNTTEVFPDDPKEDNQQDDPQDVRRYYYDHDNNQQRQTPDSIQDILQPAENHQTDSSNTPIETQNQNEDDPDDALVNAPDVNEEYYGPDPDEPQNPDDHNVELEYQPTGYDQNQMARRSDESDENQDDEQDDDREDDFDNDFNNAFDSDIENDDEQDGQDGRHNEQDNNKQSDDTDDDPEDRQDDQEDDHEDYSDGGETQRIDREIIIPQIYLWNDEPSSGATIKIKTENDNSPDTDQDFDFDEQQFDKEYSLSSETRPNVTFTSGDNDNQTMSNQRLRHNNTDQVLKSTPLMFAKENKIIVV